MIVPRPTRDRLLDAMLPDYEFAGRVAVRVRASPENVFDGLRQVTLRDMPLAHALGTLRYLPGRLTGRGAPETHLERPFLAQLVDGGSVVLGQRPEREVVVGSIGRFHQVLDQEPVRLRGAAEFHEFRDPTFQKLAMSIRVEPEDVGLWLVLEHRTHALSATSRRAFARYWLVIKPLGNFVSWLLLRAVRRRAEAAARNSPATASGRSGW